MICEEWLKTTKQGMGKSMGNRECEWISARLPLWVDNGDCNSSTDVHGERGDLTVDERQQIEQHLAGCARCCQHRLALKQALAALAIAANHLPVASSAPSLWPSLERRIANHEKPKSRALALMRGGSEPRFVQPWAKLDSVRPLRHAWARDTLRELLASRGQQQPESQQVFGLFLKASIAAVFLLTLSAFAFAHRQWTSAQSTILANAVSLADPIPVPTITEEAPLEIADHDRNDVPINQLADPEPPRPVETAPATVEAFCTQTVVTQPVSDSISSMAFPCRRTPAKPSQCIDTEFRPLSCTPVPSAIWTSTPRYFGTTRSNCDPEQDGTSDLQTIT